MKYLRTCSASGMFVSNNVMSLNEICHMAEKYATILLLIPMYAILPESAHKSGKNFDRVL